MLKLMKYEFRKQIFTKFILLFLAGLLEIVFLIGIVRDSREGIATAAGLLGMLAIGALFFVSFECIITFSNDLKTKCSYMLFMTPHSSYCIIGAKALSAAVQILATAAAFVALAFLDFAIAVAKYDNLSKLMDYLKEMFAIDISANDIILVIGTIISGWFCIVLFAFLAITISTTFLANKRGKGIVSFVLFLIVCWVKTHVTELALSSMLNYSRTDFLLDIGITVIFAALSYFATSYMLDKKVSL